MRAELYAAAAVDADKGLTGRVKINRINRTGPSTVAALVAEIFSDHHATALTLRVCAGGAGCNAGRGIAGKAGFCFKARRQTA